VLSMVHELGASLIHATDDVGGTPLHYACGAGALETIEWLLEQKVPRAKDADGFVPIVRAARAAQHTALSRSPSARRRRRARRSSRR